ncbi:Predicted Zn-dependent peptidase [Psychrobacillus sp. OK028]|uniref:M16 family metallopeptidase n=1 Tax=Psychrobacillus sp. OK028 TaxID=1884359 RepID=UPI0008893D63|nr:pitrilysin family protein [Psychrobacillus sp. OK028]SDM56858.1 Predicted Zn-dependent peptidase [Psychrobacillus sp. OK028]
MINKITCKNGLRIVSEQIPYVRSVAVGIWVQAGSRYELPEENGLTHFIEHMLFKGTETRTAKQIAEEFDRIGGNINAFTSKENTCYYAKVLDHHAEHAVDILADMFFHSQFDANEIEKERQVVLEEINMVEDTPDDIVHEYLWQAMYEENPLGAPILGTEETLNSFTKETILAYMKKHYTPENVVISVAGNIPEGLLQHIEELFSRLDNEIKEKIEVTTPILKEVHVENFRETEQAHLCLAYPSLSVKADNIYSLVVMNNILGGSMSSRLFQEIREEKGLAYSIYSYHSSYEDTGALAIYGGTSSNQLEELTNSIQETIQNVLEKGFTETEVSNAKEQLKGNLLLGLESSNARMSRNGKNELLYGEHRSLDEVSESIDEVTLQSVMELARETFSHKPAISIIKPKVDQI